jgi:hypothetical protein
LIDCQSSAAAMIFIDMRDMSKLRPFNSVIRIAHHAIPEISQGGLAQ